jgi:aspartokinase
MRGLEPLYSDKIGGAGLATATHVDALVARVQTDMDGRIAALTVSGPGGVAGRVTELALEAVDAQQNNLGHVARQTIDDIGDRLVTHGTTYGRPAREFAKQVTDRMRAELFAPNFKQGNVIRGGECYSALLTTYALRQAGVPAELIDITKNIHRDPYGAIQLERSAREIAARLKPGIRYVIPGSPGVDSNGRVMDVTPDMRGFTDFTGRVFSEALPLMYPNRPIVYRVIKEDKIRGILRMPPDYGDTEVAPYLSDTETETLARSGNNVVHPTAVELSKYSQVPMQVKNSDPTNPGTIIMCDRPLQPGELLAGIAVEPVVTFSVEDLRMEHQSDVAGTIYHSIGKLGVRFSDLKTGVGVVEGYLSRATYEANQAVIERTMAQQGIRYSVQGDGDKDEAMKSIVTLVGDAMDRDKSVLSDVMAVVPEVNKQTGTYPDTFWHAKSALHIVLSTAGTYAYVVAAHDKFFPQQPSIR